jgi:hypothetical protein
MIHFTDANKWMEEFPKGLLCAKFQCYNKPRNQCSECSIYYYIEHVTLHIHTDIFQDLQREQERDIDNTR